MGRIGNMFARMAAAAALAVSAAAGREYQVFDVVGDSISAGVNPGFGTYGWVHMLFGQLADGQEASSAVLTNLWPGIVAYNSSVSGSTAKHWAGAQPSYLQTVSNHHPDLVVVFIGGNDGLAYAADGVYSEAEKEEFRTNLVAIVQQLRANSPVPDIVVVNYYDLFDGLSSNLPPVFAAYQKLSAAVATGNQMIAGVAASNGCFYVDVHSGFMHHAYGGELGDAGHLSPDYVRTPLAAFDIHPVTAGHHAIRLAVYERLGELKEIPKFLAPSGTADQAVIRWRSGIGQSYVLQRATDSTNAYEGVATNAGTPPLNVLTDSVEAVDRAFYRILVE